MFEILTEKHNFSISPLNCNQVRIHNIILYVDVISILNHVLIYFWHNVMFQQKVLALSLHPVFKNHRKETASHVF